MAFQKPFDIKDLRGRDRSNYAAFGKCASTSSSPSRDVSVRTHRPRCLSMSYLVWIPLVWIPTSTTTISGLPTEGEFSRSDPCVRVPRVLYATLYHMFICPVNALCECVC